MSGHMALTYRYSRLCAIICFFLGHRWFPYDLNTDKCLRCCKEKRLGIFW